VLVDADALNILAAFFAEKNKIASWLTKKAKPFPDGSRDQPCLILTPHEGELKRLYEATKTSTLEDLAQLLNCVIVAKGPKTLIVSPTQYFTSTTGTVALAKAGTGDVLSGIIGALLAQGAPPFKAAVLGVELHGRAGRLAEQKFGRRSVCAEDIIEGIATNLQKLDALMKREFDI
jgi:hydroxyethylthiazole kinase-like uncharacterized protein yjeF